MIPPSESVVDPAGRGFRLDRFLAARFPSLSPRSLRYVLERGEVRVNGAVSRKGRILAEGDRVLLPSTPENDDWLPLPCDLPGASVLYDDGDLVVLDKPPNVHTEPQSPREAGTLAGYLLHMYPGVLETARIPGLTLATRLDFATSGAVPAARTMGGMAHLLGEREGGRILKRYACVVEGRLDGRLLLDSRIEEKGGRKVRVRMGTREEDPARWTRIESLGDAGPGRTLVSAEIRRGKRHQIRAHLAAAGFPIVGDRIYGTGPEGGAGSDRLLLHAEVVVFARVDGKEARVVSPRPASFGTGSPAT